MRGTQERDCQRQHPQRFIPAHAGNSPQPSAPTLRQSVHPRACGELQDEHDTGPSRSGSSPRMRGTPSCTFPTCHFWRFIPAHAGNSYAQYRTFVHPEVHPAHAGNSAAVGIRRLSRMVHPRACGELTSRQTDPYRVSRFIPAHAGNSSTIRFPMTAVTVHPRACGELLLRGSGGGFVDGSSPRMRGTLFLETHDSKRFARP